MKGCVMIQSQFCS